MDLYLSNINMYQFYTLATIIWLVRQLDFSLVLLETVNGEIYHTLLLFQCLY